MTRIVVSGTAGGVGTTTVSALLAAGLAYGRGRTPRLSDHSGGTLSRRLGDDVVHLPASADLLLHDLGAYDLGAALERLRGPQDLLVLVAPATPAGVSSADSVLAMLAGQLGSAGLRRVILVCVEVFGRHRLERALAEPRARVGPDRVVVLPQDPALAVGGPIPTTRLTPRTVLGQRDLRSIVLATRGRAANQTQSEGGPKLVAGRPDDS